MVVDNSDDATEEWRPVVGYEGNYEVSSLGRIRGLIPHTKYAVGRILTPYSGRQGYVSVSLCRDGKRYTVPVHRIVTQAFLGPRPTGYTVNHKNRNKRDNSTRNLEYVTRKENTWHAART